VSRAGSLFSLAFREGHVRDYDDAKDQDAWRYGAFFTAMLDQGISLPPSVFEAWFLSAAHSDVELDRIVAVLPAAVRAAANAPRPEPAG
jgi:glutamate-1-semialdehyde 2,1-aminomutase